MPFLMSVDSAKMRDFVKPETLLEITTTLEHLGSGYAVTKARITSAGKKVADSQLKFRTVAFDQVPLADIVRSRASDVGLLNAMAKLPGDRQ
jgi:3-hydroxyacyl-[acyl-carrier-protein] dehydratase